MTTKEEDVHVHPKLSSSSIPATGLWAFTTGMHSALGVANLHLQCCLPGLLQRFTWLLPCTTLGRMSPTSRNGLLGVIPLALSSSWMPDLAACVPAVPSTPTPRQAAAATAVAVHGQWVLITLMPSALGAVNLQMTKLWFAFCSPCGMEVFPSLPLGSEDWSIQMGVLALRMWSLPVVMLLHRCQSFSQQATAGRWQQQQLKFPAIQEATNLFDWHNTIHVRKKLMISKSLWQDKKRISWSSQL